MSAAALPEGQRPGNPEFPGNCSLEAALGAIVDVYHRYSTRGGNLDLLSFDDFNVLLHEQAQHFLQNCVSAAAGPRCPWRDGDPSGVPRGSGRTVGIRAHPSGVSTRG